MPHNSRRETYDDGQYTYDDRHDAGEFDTYGQSTSRARGPSSGEYYYDHTHYNEAPYTTTSSSSRRTLSDAHGYPREGSYAGEEPLRRRLLGRESYARINQPMIDEADAQIRFEPGWRSGLSQQLSADSREARHQAHRGELHLRLEQQRQRHRETRTSAPTADDYADGNPYVRSGRSGRRGAVTSTNDPHLADRQAARDEQQAAYDDRPSSVHGYGRGWFPAYEYR